MGDYYQILNNFQCETVKLIEIAFEVDLEVLILHFLLQGPKVLKWNSFDIKWNQFFIIRNGYLG